MLGSLVFTLTMAVYLFTLAPTITMEDSGELVTAAYTLGIAHPPGFPLWVLLGKLFTFIPLGTIAWRLNLMSAFWGALAAGLFAVLINRLTNRWWLGLAFSLILAFSPIYWSQSVIAEVYTLNIFFVILSSLLLVIWQEKRADKYLLWFALLFGLSLTNHTMMILLAPAFALFIMVVDHKIFSKWQLILKMLLLALVGFSVYLYLPWRAAMHPVFNWGPITTWQDVIVHIARAQYNDFDLLGAWHGKTGIIVSFFFTIYQDFFAPTLLLAAAGLIYLWRKNNPLAILTAGVFLGNSLGIIYLRKFGWGIGIDYTYRVYYLPAFMIVIFWSALIVSYLNDLLVDFFKTKKLIWLRASQLVFGLMVVSLPLSFLTGNYRGNDLSDFWLNYDYGRNLLNSLEPNSVYYFAYDGSLHGDTEIFTLLYLQIVEGQRPDVSVVSESNILNYRVRIKVPPSHFKLDFEQRRGEILHLLNEVKDRPKYANFSVGSGNNDLGLFSLTNGYAHKIFGNIQEATPSAWRLDLAALRGLDQIDEASPYPVRGLVAHYYYNLAARYLVDGNQDKSTAYLIKAFNLDAVPFGHEYQRFLGYRGDWHAAW